jgi:type IV pilus assembly protein PilM
MLKSLRSMFRGSSAIGMEFSDKTIKLVELTIKGTTLHFKHMVSEKLPAGLVEDGRVKNPAAIVKILQQLVASAGIQKRAVHLVIPSQSILVRLLKFPDVPMKDLRKIVDFEIKHNIHLPFDEPYYDFIKLEDKKAKQTRQTKQITDQDKVEAGWSEAASASENNTKQSNQLLFGGDEHTEDHQLPVIQCDVVLVAAPKDLIEEYSGMVKAAGLVPKSVEIKAFSLYRLIDFEQIVESNGTYIVIDLNETVTDLSIFHEKQLKITRNVPLNFAAPIESSEDKIETLSVPSELDTIFFQFGDKDADFNNACNDLAHELERLMNFYRYTLNNRDQEFTHILIAGDIHRFDEVKASLKNRLNLDIIDIQPKDARFEQPQLDEELRSFAVPIGLALRGKV